MPFSKKVNQYKLVEKEHLHNLSRRKQLCYERDMCKRGTTNLAFTLDSSSIETTDIRTLGLRLSISPHLDNTENIVKNKQKLLNIYFKHNSRVDVQILTEIVNVGNTKRTAMCFSEPYSVEQTEESNTICCKERYIKRRGAIYDSNISEKVQLRKHLNDVMLQEKLQYLCLI